MESITYRTRGICARQINVNIEDGKVVDVLFNSGCSGNLQGIGRLVEGMTIADVITKLKGIDCMGRGTSCPDQLARALENALKTI